MRVNVSFSKQITDVVVQPSQVVVCLNQLGNSEGRELGPVHIVIVDPLVTQGDHLDNPLKKSYSLFIFVVMYLEANIFTLTITVEPECQVFTLLVLE